MGPLILNNIKLVRVSLLLFYTFGRVLTCKDGVVTVAGLWDIMAGEVVMIGRTSVMGLVSNLEPHRFSAVVLGDASAVVQVRLKHQLYG